MSEEAPRQEELHGKVRGEMVKEVGAEIGVGAVAEGACHPTAAWGMAVGREEVQGHNAVERECGLSQQKIPISVP